MLWPNVGAPASSWATAAPLTHTGAVADIDGFVYPTIYAPGSQGRFGPNFQFEGAVPEPGTTGLLLVGLAAVGVNDTGLANGKLPAPPATSESNF